MAKRKGSRGKSRGKSGGARIASWFVPGIILLILLFIAELALLLPPSWAPEPLEPWLASLQKTVPIPLPGAARSGDPETMRKHHDKRMAEIERVGQQELDKIQKQAEDLRKENEELRLKTTPQATPDVQATPN